MSEVGHHLLRAYGSRITYLREDRRVTNKKCQNRCKIHKFRKKIILSSKNIAYENINFFQKHSKMMRQSPVMSENTYKCAKQVLTISPCRLYVQPPKYTPFFNNRNFYEKITLSKQGIKQSSAYALNPTHTNLQLI